MNKVNISKKWELILILLFFVIFILIEIPFLNDPDNNKMILHPSPINAYTEWDKNEQINISLFSKTIYFSEKIKDSYNSYLPLSYIIPYLFLDLLFIPINMISLKVLIFIFHFLSSILVLFIIKKMIPNKERLNIYAYISFVIYLFTGLHFLRNSIFIIETFVILMWILQIFLFIKFDIDQKENKSTKYILIFIFFTNLIFVLSDILGIITTLIMIFMGLIRLKRSKKYTLLIITLFLSSLSSFLLLLTLKSTIFFNNNVIRSFLISVTQNIKNISNIKILSIYLINYFLPHIMLIFLIYIHYINRPKITEKAGKNFLNMFTQTEWLFLILASIPMFIQQLSIINPDKNISYLVLKSGLLMTVWIAFLYNKIMDFYEWKTKSFFIYSSLSLFVIIAVILKFYGFY